MGRGLRLSAVAAILVGSVGILVGSVGLAALVVWWAEGHRMESQSVLGLGLVAVGAGLTILHLTAGDDFLHRHFGKRGAAEMRRAGRRGWAVILSGAAVLGLLYFDRQVRDITAEAQFKTAFDRGRAAAKAGNWPAAAEAFSEAIRLDPSRATAYANRGVAFTHLAEPDRAVADFSEAIRLEPTNARVVYNRGAAFYRNGDHERALADFSEAIHLDPKLAWAYLARSLVYRAMGEDTKAKADREKAVELDPSLEKANDVNLVRRVPDRSLQM